MKRKIGGRREVLMNTPVCTNIIRENRLQELKSVLQTSGDVGMISFEKDLKRLLNDGVISKGAYEMYEGI